MVEIGVSSSGLVRKFVGKPRIWVGAVWCSIGLAWILLAVWGEPTPSRIVLGAIWLLLGILQVVVALLDRKNGRGFYQTGAVDETGEQH
ncbi:hypothetical protein [Cryobacterium arcticum]|uniref:Uncharacterized protein n=1 Tax=Cryobacterium arcticum TaxID=670052 RepID=A0A317ZWW6_9MICO|nr:hypothetical protein [Cryobacterium arcticum]PXA71774.1 hypothetical protein CTB96_02280 [Cryobacterium arcticum]